LLPPLTDLAETWIVAGAPIRSFHSPYKQKVPKYDQAIVATILAKFDKKMMALH
jgi:hypothetical protein